MKDLVKRTDELPPVEESADNLNTYTCLGCGLPLDKLPPLKECPKEDSEYCRTFPTDGSPHYD